MKSSGAFMKPLVTTSKSSEAFCLLRELGVGHVCTTCEMIDNTPNWREDINSLHTSTTSTTSTPVLSQVLFDGHSPCVSMMTDPPSTTSLLQGIDYLHTPSINGGASRSSTETPQNLVLDPISTSWSDDMATPFPLGISHASLQEGLNSTKSSSCNSTIHINNRENSTERNERRAALKNTKQAAPRRLFQKHSLEGDAPIVLSPHDTMSHDVHVTTVPHSTTAQEVCPSTEASSLSSLDVLFMSNSELDQLEQLGVETVSPWQPENAETGDDNMEQTHGEQNDSNPGNDKELAQPENVQLVQPENVQLVQPENVNCTSNIMNKFIYPTNSQIQHTSNIASEQLPLKRPPNYTDSSTSFTKKQKLQVTLSNHSSIKSSIKNNNQVFQTSTPLPLNGMPKSRKSSVKRPPLFSPLGEVLENDPGTGTGSDADTGSGANTGSGADTGSWVDTESVVDNGPKVNSGSKINTGTEDVHTKTRLGSNSELETSKGRDDSDNLRLPELDWEEFSTFTQAPPRSGRLPLNRVNLLGTVTEEGNNDTELDECSDVNVAESSGISGYDLFTTSSLLNVSAPNNDSCGSGSSHVAPPPSHNVVPATTHVGFATASGKAIQVSEKSLTLVQGLFNDEEFAMDFGLGSENCSKNDTLTFTSDEEIEVKVKGQSDQNMDELHSCNNYNDVGIVSDGGDPNQTVSIGNNRSDNVPQALNTAASPNLLSELNCFEDNNDPNTVLHHNNHVAGIHTCTCTHVPYSPTNHGNDVDTSSVGFTTASGRRLAPSVDSVKAAHRLFSDIADSLTEECVSTSRTVHKDCTGSTTSVHEYDQPHTSNTEQEVDCDDCKKDHNSGSETSKITNLNSNINCTPAKCSKVSSSATEVTNTIQKGNSAVKRKLTCSTSSEPSSKAACGFSTASGKLLNVSQKSLEAAKRLLLMEEDANNTMDNSSTTNIERGNDSIKAEDIKGLNIAGGQTCVGFSTASGKAVRITQKALEAAKKLFADDPHVQALVDDLSTEDDKVKQTNLKTSESFKEGSFNESFSNDQEAMDYCSGKGIEEPTQIRQCRKSHSISFSTASGKSVSISEDSLAAAKILFQDKNEQKHKSFSAGFSTASGKSVTISEDSLAAAKKLFQDNNEDTVNSHKSFSAGFSTASGKSVSISKDSLAAAKKLFQDNNEDTVNSHKSFSAGFSTASCKSVTISENSLAAAKKLFQDNNEDTVDSHKSFSAGFSTASGKSVSISEDSLAAAKMLFQDNNEQKHKSFSAGFSTASGKSVSISEDSLAATKQLFQDNIESTSDQKSITNKTRTIEPPAQETSSQIPFPMSQSHSVSTITSASKESLQIVPSVNCNEETSHKSCSHVHESLDRQLRPGNHTDQSTPLRQGHVSSIDDTLSNRHTHRLLHPMRPSSISPNHSHGNTPSRGRARSDGGDDPSASLLSPLFLSNSEIEIFEDTRLTQLNMADNDIDSSTLSPPPDNNGKVIPQHGSILEGRMKGSTKQRIPLCELGQDRRRYSRNELVDMGVTNDVLGVTVATAVDFVFPAPSPSIDKGVETITAGDGVVISFSSCEKSINANKLWRCFRVSPGVDSTLINKKWFMNHFKWIVWKLASLEVSFPITHGGRCLTLDWCLKQIKYRYDIEIDMAKRSIIHLICEGDESPNGPMVLCISGIDTINQRIEVTDGWYSIPVSIDHHLCDRVTRGLLSIGCKIFVCGAEMSVPGQCGHPLEVSDSKCLQFSINQVRRAHWSAKLGRVRLKHPPLFPLSSVIPQGGPIPLLEVLVARVFPILYMEKTSDGRKVFRTQKMEETRMKELEKKRSRRIEELYQKIEKECEEDRTREERASIGSNNRRSGRITPRLVRLLKDGESLYSTLQTTHDPDLLMRLMSPTQHTLLQSYQESKMQENQQIQQKRFEAAMKQLNSELTINNSSISLLRILIIQHGPEIDDKGCILTIWHPTNELMELVHEGSVIRIYWSTSIQRIHENRVQLSTTKKTRFEKLHHTNISLDCQYIRKYVPIANVQPSSVRTTLDYFDTIGRIVTILPSQSFQRSKHDMVYIGDNEMNVLKIWLWNDIESLCMKMLMVPGSVVCICNLQLVHNPTSNSYDGLASDKSLMTSNPSPEYLSTPLHEMKGISKSQEDLLMQRLLRVIQEL